jgi:hypothetical protein
MGGGNAHLTLLQACTWGVALPLLPVERAADGRVRGWFGLCSRMRCVRGKKI